MNARTSLKLFELTLEFMKDRKKAKDFVAKIEQTVDDKFIRNTHDLVRTKDVISLKKDGAVLRQDVTELKQDVSVLKQDVSILKQDVSVLKQDVAELKRDVSGLKQDVLLIENKLGAKIYKVGLLQFVAITGSIMGMLKYLH